MRLAGSTSDRAKTSRADGQHLSMARRNPRKSWSRMRSGSITVCSGSCAGLSSAASILLGQVLRPSQGLDSRPPGVPRRAFRGGDRSFRGDVQPRSRDSPQPSRRSRPLGRSGGRLRWLTIFPGRVCTKPDPPPPWPWLPFGATAEQADRYRLAPQPCHRAGEPTDSLEQAVGCSVRIRR